MKYVYQGFISILFVLYCFNRRQAGCWINSSTLKTQMWRVTRCNSACPPVGGASVRSAREWLYLQGRHMRDLQSFIRTGTLHCRDTHSITSLLNPTEGYNTVSPIHPASKNMWKSIFVLKKSRVDLSSLLEALVCYNVEVVYILFPSFWLKWGLLYEYIKITWLHLN